MALANVKNVKHVGQLVNTQKRVVVVFRELPEDTRHCLVVDTDSLPDWMHDNIIDAVESPGAQACANFYEYAERTVFTDGTNMLQTLHKTNRLQLQETANVVMTPNNSVHVPLDELNTIINEQSGGAPVVSPPKDQLGMAGQEEENLNESVQPETPSLANPDPAAVEIDDVDMAQSLLAQADQFAAEADRLRLEAYELNPSLKPKRGRKSKAQLEAEAAAAAAVASKATA